MIELKNITFGYRKNKPIFKNYSLKIDKGDRIALTGASGCGKTTLLRLITGLEVVKGGEIIKQDNLKYSVVFQENRLIPHKTVLENIALFSSPECAISLLESLEILELAERLPSELSGGQKRRVAIARALCHDFDILLLDEPFTGLDKEIKDTVMGTIDRFVGDKTLVLITHEIEDAKKLNAKIVF